MPLLRPRWMRVLVALLLLLEAGVALLAAAAISITEPGRTVLPIVLAAAVAPVCVWPVIAGRWARRWGVPFQAAAVGGTVVFYATVAVLAVGQALALGSRRTEGTPVEVAVGWIALAVAAVFTLAALVAALPLPNRRLAAVVAGGVAATALVGAGGAVAVASGPDSCERFRFDRARWAVAVERGRAQGIAEAIVRCHTFTGATRAEARRALGRPRSGGWYVGMVGDVIGFGHPQELRLRYSGDRVTGAWLTYDSAD